MNCLFSSSNCHASLCYVTNLVSKYTTTSKDYSEGHLFNSFQYLAPMLSHPGAERLLSLLEHQVEFFLILWQRKGRE